MTRIYGLIIGLGAAVVFAGLVAGGCTSTSAAKQAAEASGFTDVVITGWSPLSCSDDDVTCTGFEATSPNGKRVRGAVGCGIVFKGCTVRLSR